MKVPLKWLKDYVDITLPPVELAERLTMAGFESQEIKSIGANWDNVVVGQITAINPHPNADRLLLPTVDSGTEQQTVVCGAPNLNVGDKIAFARVGAELIDPRNGKPARLTPATIRGVESSGMICSEKELGISDSHEGILILPPEAPVGIPLADYLGDIVLDLDITPNRPDCLSVTGIARETAALTGQSLHIPEIGYEEAGAPIDEQVTIEIIDPELCPRYCVSLIKGIKIAESPKWLQERLIAGGMRPINNIVDITNYVMLEYGQPLHAFDYDKIKGKKIIIRRAAGGEVIESLDGVERTLSHNTLVIADEKRAVAIAGVMGGANSEVTENTTSILLESASFKPASIHYTSRQLSLISEASMRFERGISPGMTLPALRHATQLMLQLAGGEVARGITDVYPGEREAVPILLTPEEVKRILGTDFSRDQIVKNLASLGFDCEAADKTKEIQVSVPYWRSDIQLTVDLIEEVARITGYDQMPTTMLSQPIPHHNPDTALNLKRKIRQSLVGYGFQEILTYSLVNLEMLNKLRPQTGSPEVMPLRVANPMTVDQEYLRPHLRTNVLAALLANRRYEDGGIRLFELGKVYLPREKELPAEPDMLCAILSGARIEKSWLGKEEAYGFYDVKGITEGLFSRLDIKASFEPGSDESLHPVEQAAIMVNSNQAGVIGRLHPRVADAFDITEPVYLLEIKVTALLTAATVQKLFAPLPRFPGIVRDMALVVDTGITQQKAQDIISSFPLVSEVSLFDIYLGKQVAAGKKSLAYRVVYQSPSHTLTDNEADEVQSEILGRLNKDLGATLRS